MPIKGSGKGGRGRVDNVLHKTSKGMREINYQDTQQFEQADMLQLLIPPLLVLSCVSHSVFILVTN